MDQSGDNSVSSWLALRSYDYRRIGLELRQAFAFKMGCLQMKSGMADKVGIEPTTPGLTIRCSNQSELLVHLVEKDGIEPSTQGL